MSHEVKYIGMDVHQDARVSRPERQWKAGLGDHPGNQSQQPSAVRARQRFGDETHVAGLYYAGTDVVINGSTGMTTATNAWRGRIPAVTSTRGAASGSSSWARVGKLGRELWQRPRSLIVKCAMPTPLVF
jgi:hypothetical protein